MEDWIRLSRLSTGDAVLNIRLNCEEKLRCAIDAQFSQTYWESLSKEDAFDAIKKIVTKSINMAVLWDKFFNRRQVAGESAKEYIHQCQQLALDCDFQCPHCNSDVSEYILLRKLVNGLSDVKLKQDVLQNYERFNTVEKFMVKCESFEECAKAPHRGDRSTEAWAGVGASVESDHPTPEVGTEVAGVRTNYKKQKSDGASVRFRQKCGFCGQFHAKGRSNCPAANVTCFDCGRVGHFALCCRNRSDSEVKVDRASGKGGSVAGTTIGTVEVRSLESEREAGLSNCDITMCVGAASCTQPVLSVQVVYPKVNKHCVMDVVADTGAEACIAGIEQAKYLGIDINDLNSSYVKLQHAAGGAMNVLGRCELTIRHGSRVASECVYFVEGTRKLFLSLNACKSLGLVDQDFPNHTVGSIGMPTDQLKSSVMGRPERLPFTPLEEKFPNLSSGCWNVSPAQRLM